jgi:hypothetical protein
LRNKKAAVGDDCGFFMGQGARLQRFYSTALTMSSMTFLASPNTIMVLSM